MSLALETKVKQQKIDEVMQSLQRARDLVRSREEFGVEGIHQFVQDVNGDWLENWTDETGLTSQPTKNNTHVKSVSKLLLSFLTFRDNKSGNPKMSMALMV